MEPLKWWRGVVDLEDILTFFAEINLIFMFILYYTRGTW